MTVTEKRRALGRGLDALLPEATVVMGGGKEQVFTCPIERLVPQKGQPRQHFDDARLEELAQSIREHGVLEPLIVRRAAGTVTGGMDSYEIIAGERRWRAAQKAGLHELLVVVKDVTPTDTFELALIENIQREDLNPLELAEAMDRLIRDHSYTQEVLANRIGKDRTTIANSLRLLKLPPKVRRMVIEGTLSEGHARALLGAASGETMERLAEKVARGGLSVRETERLVRSTKAGGRSQEAPAKKSASVRDLEERLARHLGTRVQIADASGKGEIAIRYASLDELDRILDVIFK
ncbi:MAG TPA: ParB/RepB/Spo0J family partition protein [Polyangiaceae bacterium]|jgi:ParB family chromosome partitioning protein|nr:ParB/RepB/Spo0J family partition protein [Polyangiaceae bacterium]